MRRVVIAIVAIVFIGISMFAQNNQSEKFQKGRAEIMNRLASIKGISITYLTESSLKRLNKDKTNSPLALLSKLGNIKSVRVFEFDAAKAYTLGKAACEAQGMSEGEGEVSGTWSKAILKQSRNDLLEFYKAEYTDIELFHLQRDSTKEIMIYAIPHHDYVAGNYETILINSKISADKSVFLILSGFFQEQSIGALIDAFSE